MCQSTEDLNLCTDYWDEVEFVFGEGSWAKSLLACPWFLLLHVGCLGLPPTASRLSWWGLPHHVFHAIDKPCLLNLSQISLSFSRLPLGVGVSSILLQWTWSLIKPSPKAEILSDEMRAKVLLPMAAGSCWVAILGES